jgi:Zinc-finger of C2H2 type
MSQNECNICKTIFKSKYNLKSHLTTNKKCLKLRGLELTSNFVCKGCDAPFVNNKNMNIHLDSCKKYIILKVKEEYDIKIQKIKDEKDLEIQQIRKEKDLEIHKIIDEKKLEIHKIKCENIQALSDLTDKFEKEISDIKLSHSNLIKDMIISHKEELNSKNFIEHDKHTKLQVSYDILEKQHEKTITKLELKIAQCDAFIQTLAREGSNKVTTTNNTINNTIRNQLSSTYTVESLEPKQLEDTMRQHYTESDFFGGQKRLAGFCVDRVIKTPDNKMMVCCTDTARKKFKILDIQGNLKEDIEARLLCKKLKVPVKMITKEIYDTVIERIEKERDRLSSDDRSRREKLLDDSMRAQQMYMDNLNFDDLNYNQDFMHELCVLLNV